MDQWEVSIDCVRCGLAARNIIRLLRCCFGQVGAETVSGNKVTAYNVRTNVRTSWLGSFVLELGLMCLGGNIEQQVRGRTASQCTRLLLLLIIFIFKLN